MTNAGDPPTDMLRAGRAAPRASSTLRGAEHRCPLTSIAMEAQLTHDALSVRERLVPVTEIVIGRGAIDASCHATVLEVADRELARAPFSAARFPAFLQSSKSLAPRCEAMLAGVRRGCQIGGLRNLRSARKSVSQGSISSD